MTTTLVTTDVIGTNQTYTFGAIGDTFVLAAGTRLLADGYSYLFGTTAGINVTIDGYLWLEGKNGSNTGSPFYFTGGDRITIGADAQVVLKSSSGQQSSGFLFSGIMLGNGIFGAGQGGTQFVNHGHVTTTGGNGFLARGGGNDLRNFGTIDVTNGQFIYGEVGGDTFLNAGTLSGVGQSTSGLVRILDGGNYLINTGEISVSQVSSVAVVLANLTGTNSVTNSGTISAFGGTGVQSAGGFVLINNSGTISAPTALVLSASSSSTVINTGVINGGVFLSDGDDNFNGIGGTVTGSISGGLGSDSYSISDSDQIIIEQAGGGTDTVQSTVDFQLRANIEKLVLLGFAGEGIGSDYNNSLTGNATDNRLLGLGGKDYIKGLGGDDVISGGSGNDTVLGGDGDDVMSGGIGNDSLSGGNDSDVITGNLGVDKLIGGLDSDRFVFLRAADSGTTVATADTISDFVTGQDMIDLAGIDANTANALANDSFAFIGAAAFSNVAGQLRYASGAGVTTLQMDMDGNGTADMTIRLTGAVVLTAQDFIL